MAGEILDEVLENLQSQLSRYQHLARRERERTDGKTAGSVAYLQGAVVASERAVDVVKDCMTRVY